MKKVGLASRNYSTPSKKKKKTFYVVSVSAYTFLISMPLREVLEGDSLWRWTKTSFSRELSGGKY